MATAALPGYVAFLYVEDGGGNVKVGELRELTLDVEGELFDATSHDGAPFREFIKGLINWTITASVLHITADTAQGDLRAAILSQVLMTIELREEDSTGKVEWQGTAFVSGQSLSFPNDDVMTGEHGGSH